VKPKEEMESKKGNCGVQVLMFTTMNSFLALSCENTLPHPLAEQNFFSPVCLCHHVVVEVATFTVLPTCSLL